MRTPDAACALEQMSAAHPDLLVGAGTVLDVAQARRAVDGGVPGGSCLLIANQLSDEVALFPLTDGGSGIAGPETRVEVRQPTCVSFWTG